MRYILKNTSKGPFLTLHAFTFGFAKELCTHQIAVCSVAGVVSSKRVRRARSVDLAGVIKAAGGSGKTDPTEFIEQQQRLLDEIKSLKTGATSAAAHMYTSCPSGNGMRNSVVVSAKTAIFLRGL